jgi:hypothetical protein
MSNFTNKLFVMYEMDKNVFINRILFDTAEVPIYLGKRNTSNNFFTTTSVLYCAAPEARCIFSEVVGPKVNSALFQQELNPEFFLSDW